MRKICNSRLLVISRSLSLTPLSLVLLFNAHLMLCLHLSKRQPLAHSFIYSTIYKDAGFYHKSFAHGEQQNVSTISDKLSYIPFILGTVVCLANVTCRYQSQAFCRALREQVKNIQQTSYWSVTGHRTHMPNCLASSIYLPRKLFFFKQENSTQIVKQLQKFSMFVHLPTS